MRRIIWQLIWHPSFIVTLLCLLYSLAVVNYRQDPLALVTLGARFAPADLAESAFSDEGYDGQMGYYIARYGWQAEPFLDVPAYRMQRILLPIIVQLAASPFGDPALPWLFLLVNLAALATGTWALGVCLSELRANRWLSLGYGLSLGLFGATRLSTTEPLAYGCAIVGILLVTRQRYLGASICFSMAILSKETAALIPFAYGLTWLVQRHWVRAIMLGAVSVGPFAVWQVVLRQQFGSFGIGSGGALATSFEIIPLMGFLRILTEGGVLVFITLGLIIGLFVILPASWALWLCWRDLRGTKGASRSWDAWTTLLFVNAAIMLFVPFSTYRELVGILRFIVGLQIALILYSAHRRHQRTLRYTTLWSMSSLFVMLSDFA